MSAIAYLQHMAQSDEEFLSRSTPNSYLTFKSTMSSLGFQPNFSSPIQVINPKPQTITAQPTHIQNNKLDKIDVWQQLQDERVNFIQQHPQPYFPTYPIRQKVDLQARFQQNQSNTFFQDYMNSPRSQSNKGLYSLQDSAFDFSPEFKGKNEKENQKNNSGITDQSSPKKTTLKKKSNLKTKENSKEETSKSKPKKTVQIKEKNAKSPQKGVKTVDQFIKSPKNKK